MRGTKPSAINPADLRLAPDAAVKRPTPSADATPMNNTSV
jgi:hypothetical protein